jgi:hypothetical protein
MKNMAREKRSKTNPDSRTRKIIRRLLRIIPLLCVLAVVALFYMLFDMQNKIEDSDYNVDINDYAENETETNTLNNSYVLDESDGEVMANEIVTNDSNSLVSNPTIPNVVSATDVTNGTTDKKLKAEEIVANDWGEDDGVSFDCYVNSAGEYIVGVTDIQSGKVLTYYLVNLDTEEISEY